MTFGDSNLLRVTKQFKTKLSNSQKKVFDKENLQENFRILSFMSCIIFVLELLVFFIPSSVFDYRRIILYFLCSSIVLIPFIIVIHKTITTIYTKKILIAAYLVQYLYIASLMYLGIALAVGSQGYIDYVHMYVIVIASVMSFITFNFIERTIILSLSYLCFVVLLYAYQPNRDVLSILIINTFVTNVIAWFFSYMKYIGARGNFLDKVQLEKIAQCDSMTMLYNHEATLAKLENEMAKANANKTPLSIVMIDIDNFKEINDSKGHVAGDMTIKELARVILSATTVNDTIGRYGGDEFIIILSGANTEKARAVTSAIMAGAAKCSISVTLSAGISEYKGENLSDYVKLVDKKLYKAKELGKNRYIDCLN